MNSSNRSTGIDLLRGLSVLYIVGFWHMLDYTNAIPNYDNLITHRIKLIVLSLFVFISGYLVGTKKIELTRQAIISFYKNRFARIYPLFFLALTVYYLFGLSDLVTSAKASVLVSMFFRPAPPTLWFITMLFLFYAATPILSFAVFNFKIQKIISLYSSLSMLLAVYFYFFELLDFRFLEYLPSYIFGLLVANRGFDYFNNKKLFSLLLIGTGISFLFNTSHVGINGILATLMMTICPYYLLFYVKDIEFSSQRTINAIATLSYSSYCMYLFHRPIYMVFRKIFFPDSEHLQLIYLILFCLPCIILFSYTLQKTYDMLVQKITNS